MKSTGVRLGSGGNWQTGEPRHHVEGAAQVHMIIGLWVGRHGMPDVAFFQKIRQKTLIFQLKKIRLSSKVRLRFDLIMARTWRIHMEFSAIET